MTTLQISANNLKKASNYMIFNPLNSNAFENRMFCPSIVNETNPVYTTNPMNWGIPVDKEFESVDDYLLSLKRPSATTRVATENSVSSKTSSSEVGVTVPGTYDVDSKKRKHDDADEDSNDDDRKCASNDEDQQVKTLKKPTSLKSSVTVKKLINYESIKESV